MTPLFFAQWLAEANLRPGVFHFFPVLTISPIQSAPALTYATFLHSAINIASSVSQPAASARARPNCPVAPPCENKVPPFATQAHTAFFPKLSGSDRPRRRAPHTGNQKVKVKFSLSLKEVYPTITNFTFFDLIFTMYFAPREYK